MKKKEIKYENYVSTTEQILRSTPEEKDKKKWRKQHIGEKQE